MPEKSVLVKVVPEKTVKRVASKKLLITPGHDPDALCDWVLAQLRPEVQRRFGEDTRVEVRPGTNPAILIEGAPKDEVEGIVEEIGEMLGEIMSGLEPRMFRLPMPGHAERTV